MAAPWWTDPNSPTCSLDEFLADYEGDSNLWWRIDCGHHQNLFDAAMERLDAVRELVEHAKKISPSPSMSVYVGDLELALGLRTGARPHKLGMADD